jgi:hypothetical protein
MLVVVSLNHPRPHVHVHWGIRPATCIQLRAFPGMSQLILPVCSGMRLLITLNSKAERIRSTWVYRVWASAVLTIASHKMRGSVVSAKHTCPATSSAGTKRSPPPTSRATAVSLPPLKRLASRT